MSDSWYDSFHDSQSRHVLTLAEKSVAEMGSATADSIGVNHGLIQNLFELDRAQSVEIRHLRATVAVLVRMLLNAGALDETAFKYQLEAEVDRVDAEAKVTEAKANMVQCYNCGRQVDPAHTQIDTVGTVCDRCFA